MQKATFIRTNHIINVQEIGGRKYNDYLSIYKSGYLKLETVRKLLKNKVSSGTEVKVTYSRQLCCKWPFLDESVQTLTI